VGEAEVGTGDRDEAEHDRRGLRDRAAVGPLDALKLGPACAQEADDAVAAAERCARGALGADAAVVAPAAATSDVPAAAAGSAAAGLELLKFVLGDVALGSGLLIDFALGEVVRFRLDVAFGRRGDAAGAAHEGGVELVDLARGVVERAGQIGAHGLAGRDGSGRFPTPRAAALAALLRTFAITGH